MVGHHKCHGLNVWAKAVYTFPSLRLVGYTASTICYPHLVERQLQVEDEEGRQVVVWRGHVAVDGDCREVDHLGKMVDFVGERVDVSTNHAVDRI